MSEKSNLIEHILSSYNTITENKKLVFEVNDIYDNIEFKNIGLGNPSSDNINTALLKDIQTAAKTAGLNVSITTAVSGHGTGSRHETGDAVDIAMINGKAVSLSNRADADKLVAALVSMGYNKNAEGPSNPKAVLTFGFEGHDDHVHVSNKTKTTSQEPTSTQSSGTTQTDTSTDTSDTSGTSIKAGETAINSPAANFARRVGQSILGAVGIKESFAKSSFGKNIQVSGGKVLIPKKHNEKIKSPVSGKIVDVISNSSCINQIVIEFSNREGSGYLEFCGVTRPNTKLNDKVGVGTVIGTTNSNVTVTQYTERKKVSPIKTDNDDKPENTGIVSLLIKKKESEKEPKTKEKKDKEKRTYHHKSGDSELAKTLVKGYRALKGSEKLDENIKRIKGLL